MNITQTWRSLVCSLFIGALVWQPTISFGQELPTAPVTPPSTACCTTRMTAPDAEVIAAAVARQPHKAALTSTSIGSMEALGDRLEMARVHTAIATAAIDKQTQPAPKPASSRAPASPLAFTPTYTVFLPLVTYAPGELYGYVNDHGAPVSSVSVFLRHFDGVSNTTVATTTTDANGRYSFINFPALTSTAQQYWIRYDNLERNTDRLALWLTQVITTYAFGDHYGFATFDIANVVLGSPQPEAVIAAPQTFTWTWRTATPSDSYEMQIYDPAGVYTSSFSSGLLGYTGTKTISAVPAGIILLAPYVWSVGVNSPEGGYGLSYYYSPVRFGKSGIQGRVTLNGLNASGISVQLFLQPASGTAVLKGTAYTGSDGIYQFTNAAALTSGQKYYVRYINTSNSTRLYSWYTDYLTSYTVGQRAYAGNFDIANVAMASPNGNLNSPYTFTWTPRPKTRNDAYFVEVFNATYSLYATVDAVGYTNSLSINSVPAGFSTGVTYYWDVGIYGNDGGIGISYFNNLVKFL